jgi:hypothetical protein
MMRPGGGTLAGLGLGSIVGSPFLFSVVIRNPNDPQEFAVFIVFLLYDQAELSIEP